jgi:glycerophosphoryl diester phosphodiesterase
MRDFICIGHRGARGHEPENTLRSVRKGFELGAHGVEIDVWFVQGELLVIHDRTLQRTTNGRGVLTRKTLAELRQLDAGAGERIPTLREVFEESQGKGFVNIELKGPDTAEPVLRLIDEFVNRHGARREDFLISSFRRGELRKAAHRDVRIGLLYSRPTPLYHLTARRLGVWSLHPSVSAVSRRFVEDAHRRGFKVIPYTANADTQILRLKDLGVDGLFSDFPDRVRALCEGGSVSSP